MPTGSIYTFVLRLEDKHGLKDVFTIIVRILIFNTFLIYLTLKVLYIYELIF